MSEHREIKIGELLVVHVGHISWVVRRKGDNAALLSSAVQSVTPTSIEEATKQGVNAALLLLRAAAEDGHREQAGFGKYPAARRPDDEEW